MIAHHRSRRRVRMLGAALLLLWPTAIPAAERPAGRWGKVNQNGGGVRRGSAVVWLAAEKKFLVVGGVRGNPKKGIRQPYEIQAFDPATGKWEERTPHGADSRPIKGRGLLLKADGGRVRLNPDMHVQGSAAYDPAAGHLYVADGNDPRNPEGFRIARYDVAARTWQEVSNAKPPAESDGVLPGEFGPTMVFMHGATVVLDPVNQELLFLGGRTGNADRGFVGHWAFDLGQKTWRRMVRKIEPLDALRAKCLAAIRPARDGMAAARNVFYSGLGPGGEAQAVRQRPAKLVGDALALAESAAGALGSAKAGGWAAEAIAHARGRVQRAAGSLRAARAALDDAKPDAATIRRVFEAAWALDEAAEALRAVPGPRMHAGAAYDPVSKCVVLFGGDHGDYLLSDTWVYQCGRKTWRRVFTEVGPQARRAVGHLVWLPHRRRVALIGGRTYLPKFIYFRRISRPLLDVWTFDTGTGRWALLHAGDAKAAEPSLSCELAAGEGDVVLGLASAGRYTSQWDGSTWLLRPGDGADPTAAKKLGARHGARTYLSVVREYDPCWYDAAPRGDPKAAAERLAKLPPNTWTRMPLAPRPCPRRDWGTAAFDPHRDQFYHWTGGHMADPASIVSTYHPAVHRWSIPYVAEYGGKGISFNGRPDCMNHTYLNYAYDPASRKLVCTSFGGTCVYDPDRREFQPRIDQPFRQHPYWTKTVSTPRGVVCWDREAYLGILDAAARTWRRLPVVGKLPRSVHGDENAITYDPKRDVLWMMAADGYQKTNGQVWRYDMKTGAVRAVSPEGRKTVGTRVRPRESVYLPGADLVLHNAFADGRQIAYEPQRNRWVTLSIEKAYEDLGGVSIGLMYDPGRTLVWAMSSGQKMYVLRIDAATLEVSGAGRP